MVALKRDAVEVNFELKRGATYELPLTKYLGEPNDLYDPLVPKDANGVPTTWAIIDITGYDARSKFKQDILDVVTVDDLTVANGRIVIDGVNGLITLLFPATITEAYAHDNAGYDIELIDTDGNVIDFVFGRQIVFGEFTTS